MLAYMYIEMNFWFLTPQIYLHMDQNFNLKALFKCIKYGALTSDET